MKENKVEISAWTLIEIKKAFDTLLEDKNSYLYKEFNNYNRYTTSAIIELKNVYFNYFKKYQL